MQVEVKERKIYFDGIMKITFDEILESVGALESDVVYLAGSLIEGYVDKYSQGMGNQYSDLDVFVIREHDKYESTEAVYSSDVSKSFFCDEKGLHIEVYDSNYVQCLTAVLLELNVEKNERILNTLKKNLENGNDFYFVNSFLNRFLNSICIANKSLYDKIHEGIKFEKFLELKQYFLVSLIDNAYSDAVGNIQVKQIDTALHSIRYMVLTLLEVALAVEGTYVDRDKWIALKFTNLARAKEKYNSLHSLYMNVFRGDFSDPDISLRKIELYIKSVENELENISLEDLEI